jgi:hypothetical protein
MQVSSIVYSRQEGWSPREHQPGMVSSPTPERYLLLLVAVELNEDPSPVLHLDHLAVPPIQLERRNETSHGHTLPGLHYFSGCPLLPQTPPRPTTFLMIEFLGSVLCGGPEQVQRKKAQRGETERKEKV